MCLILFLFPRRARCAFSLLEVILALAVLAGSIAILGEVSRLALRNASTARDLARAQMLCESKLAEIVAGITPAESAGSTPFDPIDELLDADEPAWLYSIETQQTDEPGLISVRVTVTRDLPPGQRPVEFSMVRWLSDPTATTTTGSGNATSGTE